MADSNSPAVPKKQEERAGHGYRNELSWRSGQGRQPYTNQEPGVPEDPACAGEIEQGDRGIHSGVTQAHMKALLQKP